MTAASDQLPGLRSKVVCPVHNAGSQAQDAFSALLPSVVALATACPCDDHRASLYTVEERSILGAVTARRNEFAGARACARRALARLGRAGEAIPVGTAREPVWPIGIVGSLTHCAGLRAGAVAPEKEICSIGIDAEPHAPMPPGVLPLITSPVERQMLRRLSDRPESTNWDRLLFSAKETIFKTWYPLTRRSLDFVDCEARIDAEAKAFSVRFVGRLAEGRLRAFGRFAGRWTVTSDFILTAGWVPAAAASGKVG